MTHGSLFSGIGGFDLAAQWMGWTNVFHVERDPFCRQVLSHHFPESQSFDDVKTFDAAHFRGRVSVISGGFPCQPFSAAGKRAGTSDDRYLWPEMFRIIREARPTYVVAENVRGLLSWNEGLVLDTVCADLEGEGYEVFPTVLPAASVNAPHRRDRIWIVAHSVGAGAGRKGGETCHQGRTTGEDRGESIRQAHRPTLSGGSSTAGADGTPPHSNNRLSEQSHEEVPQRDDHAQPCDAGSADASNTGSMGRQRRRSEEAEGREGQRLGLQPDSEGQGSGWNVADPISDQRPKGGRDSNRSKEAEGHAGLCAARPRTWEDFPSVAPLCGGDDGLPKRLDGITFPKWRRESIKAYGNAIVPQVALQIFRALEDIDRRTA